MIEDGKPIYCGPEPYCIYLSDRRIKAAYVVNEGSGEARLGSHSVQIDSGIPLASGAYLMLETEWELQEDWYAVSEGTSLSVTRIV